MRNRQVQPKYSQILLCLLAISLLITHTEATVPFLRRNHWLDRGKLNSEKITRWRVFLCLCEWKWQGYELNNIWERLSLTIAEIWMVTPVDSAASVPCWTSNRWGPLQPLQHKEKDMGKEYGYHCSLNHSTHFLKRSSSPLHHELLREKLPKLWKQIVTYSSKWNRRRRDHYNTPLTAVVKCLSCRPCCADVEPVQRPSWLKE